VQRFKDTRRKLKDAYELMNNQVDPDRVFKAWQSLRKSANLFSGRFEGGLR
jgi:hypothetical protein